MRVTIKSPAFLFFQSAAGDHRFVEIFQVVGGSLIVSSRLIVCENLYTKTPQYVLYW